MSGTMLANQIVQKCGVVMSPCNTVQDYRIVHLTVDCFKDMLDAALGVQKGGGGIDTRGIVRYCQAYGIDTVGSDTLVPGTILGLDVWTETPVGQVYNAKDISILNRALQRALQNGD